jgi:CO/xanthine dehydrogenase Mo-binding subunit
LIVSFTLSPAASSQDNGRAKAAGTGVKLPGSLTNTPYLDAWIRIDADGSVTAFTGKAELGQGIKTALLQITAEELEVPLEHLTLITADTALTANEGYTAGSHSMQDSGTALRNAAAQAREILLGAAASRMNVPAAQLKAASGVVIAPSGARLSYGELVSPRLLHVQAQPVSKLKDPASFRVMNRSQPRIDIPGKVTGGSVYVQDMRLPGMLHARVVRPPSYGAQLAAVDGGAVERMPGVVNIVRDGNFLAVVAEREYQAIKAMRSLAAGSKWQEQSTLPKQAELAALLSGLPSQDFTIFEKPEPAAAMRANPGKRSAATGSGNTSPSASGSPPAGAPNAETSAAPPPTAAATALEATYTRPYVAHASIGPSCAVAQLQDEMLTVWTHTQGVYPDRQAIAEMLGLPPDRVHCIHVQGSGCYGHNGADDAAGDAALLASKMPGRPIRVQWMREQEFTWEPFGPAMVTKVRASLDSSGRIGDWDYGVWSNTHSMRPGPAGALLAGQHMARALPPPAPKPLPQPEGGGDRNAIPLYALPHAKVVHHFIPSMPLRISALRSLGGYMNVFSIESFMDELALAGQTDPVAFRLKHLDDPRAREVVTAAADRFGWSGRQRGGTGRGCGFGFARYKNLAAYCAIAVQLAVEHETGHIRVERIVAAVDTGQAVNPDGIRNQIEGGILQSMSWTLYETVSFDDTRILCVDWSTYPILRFNSVPNSLDVHIVDRPGQPFLGCGEASQGPASAALANAVADATGKRLRDLPLTAARVKAAIGV